MKRRIPIGAVLMTSVVLAGVGCQQSSETEVAAQTAEAPAAGVPTFRVDPDWPEVPAEWKLGDVSSVAIDAQDNVWMLHRPRTLSGDEAEMAAPAVIGFDPEGNFIRVWGGAGDGYEWPQREHGLHIDHQEFAWLGGNNCPERNLPGLEPVADDQVLKFTLDGEFVMQIGRSNMSGGNADTENLHEPADVRVHPPTNELFVADGHGNHRVAVFDVDTGDFKRMWGAFGNVPVDLDQCPNVTLDSVPDGPGPDQFSIVHAIRVSNDGMVYVADHENRRVQVFTLDGEYVDQIVSGGGAVRAKPGAVTRSRAAVPVCRRGFRDHGARSSDARYRDDYRRRRHAGSWPPDRNRLAGQPLHRRDRQRISEAVVHGPLDRVGHEAIRRIGLVSSRTDGDRATWLTFRRTYSSWSHEQGVPGKVVAQLMGHANVDTTLNVYTQVLDGSLRAAVDKIGTELFTMVQSPPGGSSLTHRRGWRALQDSNLRPPGS